MDAFIETNDTAFFFEFKCHEIFDPHKKTLSRQYDDNYLNKWGIKRNHEEIPYSEFGLDKIKLFDLKQFITHMVGIVNFSDSKNKRIVFSYVYFKPDNADQNIYKELKEEVKAVFNSKVIKKICNENNIELRLYFYKNNIMDGFEKEKKPTRINLDE